MVFIVYILIGLACIGTVYYGYTLGGSQFYMSVFAVAIICYCVYMDFKGRREKKEEENQSNKKSSSSSSSSSKSKKVGKKTGNTQNISKIAHKSTKDKDLKK